MKHHIGGTFSELFGTIFKAFGTLIFGIIRLLLKCLIFFGLWVPLLYAVLGVILYYVCHFDVFDFSTYSILYLSGGAACVVCMIVITILNGVVRPAKKAFNGDENKPQKKKKEKEKPSPSWEEKKEEKKAESLSPPLSESFVPEKPKRPSFRNTAPTYLPAISQEDLQEKSAPPVEDNMDWLPHKKTPTAKPEVVTQPKKEKPEIYFSTIRPDILVYEYSDRFELFRVVNDRTVSVGVELKL